MTFTNVNSGPQFFLLEADTDYISARCLNINCLFFRAAYFAQQALEKYLKAFCIQAMSKYRRTHDLEVLLKDCLNNATKAESKLLTNLKFKKNLIKLNYDQFFRYPSAQKELKVFSSSDVIPNFDRTVSLIRPLIKARHPRGLEYVFLDQNYRNGSPNPATKKQKKWLMIRNDYIEEQLSLLACNYSN